jgi:hypothetical protein
MADFIDMAMFGIILPLQTVRKSKGPCPRVVLISTVGLKGGIWAGRRLATPGCRPARSVEVSMGYHYESFLPAPGPGARPKMSSILMITAPLDFRGIPALFPMSSIQAAVSS